MNESRRLIDVDRLKRQLKMLPKVPNWGEAFLLLLINTQPIVLKLKEDKPDRDGLKRCPICGGKAVLRGDADSVFWVDCTQCRLDAAPSRDKDAANRRWNDRIQKWLYEEESRKDVKKVSVLRR